MRDPMFRGLPQFEEGRKIGNAERAYRTVLRETKDRAKAEAARDAILNHDGDLPYASDVPAGPMRISFPEFTRGKATMPPPPPPPDVPAPEGYLRKWENEREETGF
jgi:hypothetical protein